jgi:signal transduction histidine kinase
MSATSGALLGLTIIVALLVGLLLFALMRLGTALRGKRRRRRDGGDATLLTSAMEDAITRLKAQERATAARAEASERLSGEIVASLTSGLVVVDSAGRVQRVNPAARRILRLEDTHRTPDTALLDEVPALGDVIRESLRTRHPVLRRTLALERGGEAMRLGVSVSPIAAERAPAGAICLFSDLTDVFALEEQLRLKEALARLGELTAGLAHEFRNGLATIHGYARLMDPAVLPPAQRPYIEGIREETKALGEIVTQFLSFAGPAPLALAPVDLRTIVQRAAEDAPAARLTVTGEFVSVDADEVLLRQAISNLFRNSVEACGALQQAPAIDVHAHVDRAHGVVHLTLADNGPGIAPDALPRIFQPFFTQRPGGTGLGLAIVQKVIVSHNGRVSAANRPEGGALFTLTLPLRAAETVPES